jgi:uncharacterized protein YecE (DUF72 family)
MPSSGSRPPSIALPISRNEEVLPGRLYIGTSGFAYPEWKGAFYPRGIKPDAMLRYYASRFPSVEINYTYRRDASEKMLERWVADTPEDFAFALKGHRRITDGWRSRPGDSEPLELFLKTIEPLGARLGPVLLQSRLKADVGMLRVFLSLLPAGRRFAFDFRHASWRDDAVKEALAERGAAWCVADTDDHDAPFERTAPAFVYVRLRKSAYEDEAFARWAADIGASLEAGIDAYCYLKHEDGDGGRGVGLAERLREMLRQTEATSAPPPAPAEPV